MRKYSPTLKTKKGVNVVYPLMDANKAISVMERFSGESVALTSAFGIQTYLTIDELKQITT